MRTFAVVVFGNKSSHLEWSSVGQERRDAPPVAPVARPVQGRVPGLVGVAGAGLLAVQKLLDELRVPELHRSNQNGVAALVHLLSDEVVLLVGAQDGLVARAELVSQKNNNTRVVRRERAGQRRAQEARRSESSHLEILLGVVLDGVEESLGGPHVHCGAFLLGPGRSLLRGLRIPNASLLLRGLKPCLARLRRGHCHVPFTLSLSLTHSARCSVLGSSIDANESSLSLAHPKTPPWAPPKPLEGQNTTGHISKWKYRRFRSPAVYKHCNADWLLAGNFSCA